MSPLVDAEQIKAAGSAWSKVGTISIICVLLLLGAGGGIYGVGQHVLAQESAREADLKNERDKAQDRADEREKELRSLMSEALSNNTQAMESVANRLDGVERKIGEIHNELRFGRREN